MDAIALGKKLRELRGDKPQREVAEALGVTNMAISQYENGLRIPADDIKIRMARYYDMSVGSLFYGD